MIEPLHAEAESRRHHKFDAATRRPPGLRDIALEIENPREVRLKHREVLVRALEGGAAGAIEEERPHRNAKSAAGTREIVDVLAEIHIAFDAEENSARLPI